MKESVPAEAIKIEIGGWKHLVRVRTIAYFLAFAGLGSGSMAVAQAFGVATTGDVQALRADVARLQEFVFTDAAERIADKAAEPITDATRSRAIWRAARERVLDNLRAGRPARHGLPE